MQLDRLIADAAAEIHNLAPPDKPPHERFCLIVRVLRRMVARMLEELNAPSEN